jgi:hypothetical protein
MYAKLSHEIREIAWLASVAGTLIVAGASLAIAAAVAVEHLT